jgi:hypothetical protein
MATMVASDSTALNAIMIETKIGRSAPTNAGIRWPGPLGRPPPSFPSRMKIRTGNSSVPIAPSGSRRKILISSQVSLHKPRSTQRLLLQPVVC